jgi:hypothetical protein
VSAIADNLVPIGIIPPCSAVYNVQKNEHTVLDLPADTSLMAALGSEERRL